ncbi:thioredoxin family protein [Gracilibacillus alcaliphilus]|uniref:thioredoxin family protein n=1 Tax=Gracilibacillus alcaliphilus TaxID=1401441 RepID=UPI001959B670|nr:thioredoxin family protein [Gracilibacillus alcaliphilus]MBM7675920.1 thioredoxin-like negative regulator of GroEL [Gracilibacillus alcaliphilus]
MKELTQDNMEQEIQNRQSMIVFVHTPFCATCQLAEKMLRILEEGEQQQLFYRMNASFFPEFMHQHQVESVPALLWIRDGKVKEQVYAFESVTNLFHLLEKWRKKQSIS